MKGISCQSVTDESSIVTVPSKETPHQSITDDSSMVTISFQEKNQSTFDGNSTITTFSREETSQSITSESPITIACSQEAPKQRTADENLLATASLKEDTSGQSTTKANSVDVSSSQEIQSATDESLIVTASLKEDISSQSTTKENSVDVSSSQEIQSAADESLIATASLKEDTSSQSITKANSVDVSSSQEIQSATDENLMAATSLKEDTLNQSAIEESSVDLSSSQESQSAADESLITTASLKEDTSSQSTTKENSVDVSSSQEIQSATGENLMAATSLKEETLNQSVIEESSVDLSSSQESQSATDKTLIVVTSLKEDTLNQNATSKSSVNVSSSQEIQSAANDNSISSQESHEQPVATLQKQSGVLSRIPVEIFIKICKDVPPHELFYLSKLCKRFHVLLISSNFGTEQIWRSSRKNFMKALPDPPQNYSEGHWLFLNMVDLGCQFCGSGAIDPKGDLPSENPVKTYWMFRVMCCRKCLKERTVTKLQVEEKKRFVLNFLPCLELNKRPNIYWNSHVEKIYEEYLQTPRERYSQWLNEKRDSIYTKKCIASYCAGRSDDNIKSNASIKKKRFKNVANVLSSKVPNDAGREITRVISKIKQLPTYKEYWKNINSVVLFNEYHWRKFEEKLLKEWEANRRYAVTRERLYSVALKINKDYSSDKALFDYLYHCPSFRNNYPPQFSNPNESLDENFVDKEFIPKLIMEAYKIANETERPPPITTVDGIMKFRLYSLERIKCHFEEIHEINGKIVDLDKMIEVDWLEVGKQLLNRDAESICFHFPLKDVFNPFKKNRKLM
ncbi:11426_t:CDS:2 [Acaulospora morrowiae]|uniref:11426_t:CDS:1 n=1 Tax=Acaulospora morrowiae TaxID=94023 RepID=A0A9N9CKV2_9GLOM|nr:11426_t:CDS:2 [Acaulospora morrowiae]